MLHLDLTTVLRLLPYLLLLLPLAVLLALEGRKRTPTLCWVAGGWLAGVGFSLLVRHGSAGAAGMPVLAHALLLAGLGLAAFALYAERQFTVASFWAACGYLLLLALGEVAIASGSVPLLLGALGLPLPAADAHSIAWPVPVLAAVSAAMGHVAFVALVMGNVHRSGVARVLLVAEAEERERMAEVLAHMDRASNLAVISSSLGLQLGQPLAAIKLSTQLLQRRTEQGLPAETLVQELDHVVGQVRSAAQIVDQVRQYIKPPPLQPALVDVQALAKEVWELLRQEAQQQGVQVEFAAEQRPMLAYIDRVRASQVIMNVLRSGAESRLLGAVGPVRVAFGVRDAAVEVSFHLPWPGGAATKEGALPAPLLAHGAVFDSRRVAAAEMLALFNATILVRGPSPLGCEVVLVFSGAEGATVETTVEKA